MIFEVEAEQSSLLAFPNFLLSRWANSVTDRNFLKIDRRPLFRLPEWSSPRASDPSQERANLFSQTAAIFVRRDSEVNQLLESSYPSGTENSYIGRRFLRRCRIRAHIPGGAFAKILGGKGGGLVSNLYPFQCHRSFSVAKRAIAEDSERAQPRLFAEVPSTSSSVSMACKFRTARMPCWKNSSSRPSIYAISRDR